MVNYKKLNNFLWCTAKFLEAQSVVCTAETFCCNVCLRVCRQGDCNTMFFDSPVQDWVCRRIDCSKFYPWIFRLLNFLKKTNLSLTEKSLLITALKHILKGGAQKSRSWCTTILLWSLVSQITSWRTKTCASLTSLDEWTSSRAKQRFSIMI